MLNVTEPIPSNTFSHRTSPELPSPDLLWDEADAASPTFLTRTLSRAHQPGPSHLVRLSLNLQGHVGGSPAPLLGAGWRAVCPK